MKHATVITFDEISYEADVHVENQTDGKLQLPVGVSPSELGKAVDQAVYHENSNLGYEVKSQISDSTFGVTVLIRETDRGHRAVDVILWER